MANEPNSDRAANRINDVPGTGEGALPNEPLHSDEGELTPPHGDDLRDEETFGRTDRYANIDDADAERQQQLDTPKPIRSE